MMKETLKIELILICVRYMLVKIHIRESFYQFGQNITKSACDDKIVNIN